ncbi:hypothetical protein INT43_000078 [Umbelopsis isabellina]|uniref:Condensin complex subunit 2 n=1 Tax=Mortierella isabellina TaxID=91625 RepID=A0A8H7U713_MORIS|nr:hypothetical protein INT43_000078 [Umbelopsis isabellina]
MSSSFSPRVASPNLTRRNTASGQGDHSPVTLGSPSLDRHSGRFYRAGGPEESDRQSRRISARESLLRRVSGRSSLTGGDHAAIEERKLARPLDILTNAPKLPTLTNEQMYSNFEEWMKMCTDNKINATNSWNFALIDYFHEMTFLKDGDSINFQKASCTLDGCVKIYTSRVDSVASETGKLLSGLADSANVRDGEDGEDGDADEDGERRSKRKANRSEATLVKDFSAIKVKKLDLDFTVDPLFKKTSADFDEGGARGLLLNNLTIDRDCKIIFDASDAFAEAEEEESPRSDGQENPVQPAEERPTEEEPTTQSEVMDEQPEDVPVSEQAEDAMDVEQPETEEEKPAEPKLDEQTHHDNKVEVSRLKAKLPSLEELMTMEISPSLRGFEFSSTDALDIPFTKQNNDVHVDNSQEIDQDPGYQQDVQQEANDDIDDLFNDIDNDDDVHQEDTQLEGFLEPADAGTDAATVKNYEMAMNPDLQADMFSYFDAAFMRNWAGPEHWKLRRPMSKLPAKDTNEQNTEEGEDAQKSKKAKKVPFEIDFLNSEDLDEATLFANDKKGSITMAVKRDSKNSTHLLPDDMHFSSRQLLHYFLKPDHSFRKRKKVVNEDEDVVIANDDINTQMEEPDAQYWAQEDEPIIDDGNLTQGDMSFAGDQTILSAVEDATFLQDAYDDINDTQTSNIYGDELITNHRLKKIKPLYVNYARTAKRVDVRRLKDNLWKTMAPPLNQSSSSLEKGTADEATEESDGLKGEHKFSEVIHNLKSEYSTRTMKDISVPFCFICLLHLANEKKLKLSNELDGTEQDLDAMGASLKDLVVVQDSM